MVVLLVVGISFVQGYTNIPFERLWELTPQSSIATGPTYSTIGGGDSTSDIKTQRFFTTDPNPYDLSEIACNIGTVIYKDFTANGPVSNRYVTRNFPYGNGHYYLIGTGVFLYNNTQYSAASYGSDPIHGYVTGTNTTVDDSVFGNAGPDYAACHICREPEQTGTLLAASVPKVAGIKNLDEACINMQLKDRVFQTKNFCTQSFNIGTNSYTFGNCDANDVDAIIRNPSYYGINPDPNNVLINVTSPIPSEPWPWDEYGDCSKAVSLCKNSPDYVRWKTAYNVSGFNQPWKVSDNEWAGTTGDNPLFDGYKYIYSVWWTHLQDTGFPFYTRDLYYIIFNMLPDENKVPTFSSFDVLNRTTDPVVGQRYNSIGRYYKEARTCSIFNVNLAGTEPISVLRERISQAFGRGINYVKCLTCDNPSADEPFDMHKFDIMRLPSANACMIIYENVILWTNATLPNGYNDNLPAGNYRVIVRDWYNSDLTNGCYMDNTVIIYKTS
jgi:hypothetical protein